jgi:hypothetical protein
LWSNFSVLTREHFYRVGGKEENRNPVVESLVTNFGAKETAPDRKKPVQYSLFDELQTPFPSEAGLPELVQDQHAAYEYLNKIRIDWGEKTDSQLIILTVASRPIFELFETMVLGEMT